MNLLTVNFTRILFLARTVTKLVRITDIIVLLPVCLLGKKEKLSHDSKIAHPKKWLEAFSKDTGYNYALSKKKKKSQ